MTVPLSCQCGAFRGEALGILPTTGRRIVCYCDDCQTYAHFLKNAEKILDQNGGTEVYPMRPSQIKITGGHQHLKCMRLSPKGMLRWYAGCCQMPIANSMPSYKVPFVSLISSMMDFSQSQKKIEDVLGPIRGRVQGKFGYGSMPEGVHPKAPLNVIFFTIKFMLVGWIKNQHKPSPFFTEDGTPVVLPTVLNRSERTDLKKLCGPK